MFVGRYTVGVDKQSKDDGSPCDFHKERKEKDRKLFDAANAYAEKFGTHWILWWIDDPKEYLDRIEQNCPWTEEEIAERDIEERKKRGMPFPSKEELIAELKGGCEGWLHRECNQWR